jgi:two-component system response regulator
MKNIRHSSRPYEILFVEDVENDVEFKRLAFEDVPYAFNFHVVFDGFAALDFVRKKGHYEHVPRPDMILIDILMPGIGGRELLGRLKADNNLRSIPTLVLSHSFSPDDICYAYDAQAAVFITKPLDHAAFCQIIKDFVAVFFSGDVQLPSLPAR